VSRIFDLARFFLSCLRRNPVERVSPGSLAGPRLLVGSSGGGQDAPMQPQGQEARKPWQS